MNDDLSPVEKAIMENLTSVYNVRRCPIPTPILSDLAGGFPERTVRHILSTRLEPRGLVVREGERGGWKPARRTPYREEARGS